MGTMTNIFAERQSRRAAYRLKKNEEERMRIASLLDETEKSIFLSGSGFIRVPAEESVRLRIDSYPRLIP